MKTVQHRDGFCLVAKGADISDGATNVETLCGWVVILPLGFSEENADCQECIDAALENAS
jgi:hypothetical protein